MRRERLPLCKQCLHIVAKGLFQGLTVRKCDFGAEGASLCERLCPLKHFKGLPKVSLLQSGLGIVDPSLCLLSQHITKALLCLFAFGVLLQLFLEKGEGLIIALIRRELFRSCRWAHAGSHPTKR